MWTGADRAALVVWLLLYAAEGRTALVFHFEDRFSSSEQEMLTEWITEVSAAMTSLVGALPFDVEVRLLRQRSGGPVPWANTLRGRHQGVRFHVDTRYPLERFRKDWTAPHEFSHLILPYLGRKNAWFAEGFASYMQYQVMHAMGVLTEDDVARRYRTRIDKAARNYGYPDRPFVDAAPRLRAEGKYPTMYWGSAVFFLHLSQELKRETNLTLSELLARYLYCCRRTSDSLNRVIATFDELIGSSVVSGELATFRNRQGFPRYDQIALGVAGN